MYPFHAPLEGVIPSGGCKSSHEVTLDEASVSAPIAGVLAARALH